MYFDCTFVHSQYKLDSFQVSVITQGITSLSKAGQILSGRTFKTYLLLNYFIPNGIPTHMWTVSMFLHPPVGYSSHKKKTSSSLMNDKRIKII